MDRVHKKLLKSFLPFLMSADNCAESPLSMKNEKDQVTVRKYQSHNKKEQAQRGRGHAHPRWKLLTACGAGQSQKHFPHRYCKLALSQSTDSSTVLRTFPGIYFCSSSIILHYCETVQWQSGLKRSRSSSYWVRQAHWERDCSQNNQIQSRRRCSLNPPSLPSRARFQATRPQTHAAYIFRSLPSRSWVHTRFLHKGLTTGRSFWTRGHRQMLTTHCQQHHF